MKEITTATILKAFSLREIKFEDAVDLLSEVNGHSYYRTKAKNLEKQVKELEYIIEMYEEPHNLQRLIYNYINTYKNKPY